MKKTVLAILILFLAFGMFAQETTKNFTELSYMQDSLGISDNGGKVTVTQDVKLEQLMYNYTKAFKRQPDKVWRVQIYFGIGREARFRAQDIKENFENNHPGVPTYLVFEEPHFKVKVGDFDTKLDAERLKAQLEEEYGTLFITEDTRD
ncbi:MAG: hypothetical protein JXL97_09735 [Bacteroidales bacterium]|nr:hypothetical protein [Bacteroidales bacterium]